MLLDLHLQCPLHDSFRVRQVAGMFDVPIDGTIRRHIRVDLPDESDDWSIGVITGPSGSGKTAVARHAWRGALYHGATWPRDRAIIDCFGDGPIHQITRALTAVGLGSPPSWLKPFAVLSNGEKFRCELARALVERNAAENAELGTMNAEQEFNQKSSISNHQSSSIVVFDEFTSFVDRTVARIASAALSRALHAGSFAARFVAVTCHEDVIPWLAPDWVLDLATGALSRRRLRRPAIALEISRCGREMWPIFARHHYLSAGLHRSAQCFIAKVEGRPAAFCAALPFPHPKRPGWREHRLVCLPDCQGVGIGNRLSEYVASLYVSTGKPYFSTTGHPAIIHHRAASPLWRMLRLPRMVSPVWRDEMKRTGMAGACSAGRLTAGFEYVGPARAEDAATLDVGRACPPSVSS